MALKIHLPLETNNIDATGTHTLTNVTGDAGDGPSFNNASIANWGGASCDLQDDDRITVSPALEIAQDADMTCMCWVHCNDSDSPSYICSGASGSDGFEMLRTATNDIGARFGSQIVYGTGTVPTEDENYHICFTRVGSSGLVSIYVDGVEVAGYASSWGSGSLQASTKNWERGLVTVPI